MNIYLSLILDLLLIALLSVAIFHAVKLSRQLKELKANRLDMQKFVIDFNGTVLRAEAGIQGLKKVSRECGDDLEQLIEGGTSLRDELTYLVESADKMASRLTSEAANAVRSAPEPQRPTPGAAPKQAPFPPKAPANAPKQPAASSPAQGALRSKPPTAAERDLLRLLEERAGGEE